MPWWIMFFCPNWAFNIAKVGSKTLPKSEVCAIDWHPKTNKPRRSRGLWSQTWLRKRVLSAAQGAPKNWNASNAMKSINN
jgi:hypothetical protein